jgi:hypothetical protein
LGALRELDVFIYLTPVGKTCTPTRTNDYEDKLFLNKNAPKPGQTNVNLEIANRE